MIEVNRDEIIAEKMERRRKLDLEYHSDGDCIHVGKISMGCKSCFIRNNLTTYAIYTGAECNVSCGYCYYDKNRNDNNWNSFNKIKNNLADFYALTLDENCDLKEVSYNSWGETLKYPTVINEAANILKRYEEAFGKKVYTHMYTNGILANEEMLEFLKKCNIIELRFHHSASNFSKDVLENMKNAVSKGFIVSVEEASLLENKQKIMDMLPIYNEIGIKHFNSVECQITQFNKPYLDKKYPKGRMYRDLMWHLYDEGMSYDIIEQKLKNNYSFSVIDCNSRVECCRGDKQVSLLPLDWNKMNGACNEEF